MMVGQCVTRGAIPSPNHFTHQNLAARYMLGPGTPTPCGV